MKQKLTVTVEYGDRSFSSGLYIGNPRKADSAVKFEALLNAVLSRATKYIFLNHHRFSVRHEVISEREREFYETDLHSKGEEQ